MPTFVTFLTVVAACAVAFVLLAGLWNMMRGGSPNRSQALMRMRIVLQFIAIVIAMTALYFTSG
ncbi:twin transmembrane helix small protein [Acuticoccus sediminis]|uniref:Twin transmembrane helix small protein n=1 Tax=Acuticoccus sediminis TaxID=2184697 RepID=A0A8B2NSD7_9HYPH|nr:twin transmembrane helix small protein [Acuticoccus sediminis]RAI03127.1 twin transmembrane helix small protein [Acuticoccus sediminis]